jgi:hypothetical protein
VFPAPSYPHSMSCQSLLNTNREPHDAIDVIHAPLIAAEDNASLELETVVGALLDRLTPYSPSTKGLQ